jgi:hypothetical protein
MDVFRKTVTADSVLSERLPTDGRVRISTGTSSGLTTTDMAPPGGAALDSPTGVTLPAYQWDVAKTITAADPLDANGVAGIDWTRVDAEVIDGNLVVKGTLVGWINTDYGNRLEVLLDTDMDAATGDPVNNPESGGPTIGVDNVFAVHSVRMAQDASVGYFGMLTPTGGTTTRHDAAIAVRVNFSFSDPGWFTATIPLRALGNLGPKVRFYVRSGYFMGIGGDTAPPQPMVISLAQGFTVTDEISALRISGGLTPATDNRLNLDGVAGVTMSDAVRIARKVAGLEANP